MTVLRRAKQHPASLRFEGKTSGGNRRTRGRCKKAKVRKCRDAGVEFDFVARGETVEEILGKAAKHGKEAHGMKEIPQDLEEKIRSLIREETAESDIA